MGYWVKWHCHPHHVAKMCCWQCETEFCKHILWFLTTIGLSSDAFLRIDPHRYMANNCISNNVKIMIPCLVVGTLLQIPGFTFDLFFPILIMHMALTVKYWEKEWVDTDSSMKEISIKYLDSLRILFTYLYNDRCYH